MRKRSSLLARCATALKFASSSLVGFAVDYVLFLGFSALTGALAFGLVLSNAAARIVSAYVNYTINQRVVFRGAVKSSKSLPAYLLLAAGILTANSALLSLLTWFGMAAPAAKLVTELTLFVISFSVQSLVIFRSKQREEMVVHG